MSGNELGTKGKATRGKVKVDGLERSELRSRLLTPTPAQLAAGVRMIDAPADDWPLAVKQAVRRADKAGWAWRVTYSQFEAIPPVLGADVGKWVLTHSMVVRMQGPAGRAWGAWHGTTRTGWGYDSGQFWGLFMGYPVNINATELAGLITGSMIVKLKDRTGEKPDERSIFYAVEPVAAKP